MLLNSGSHIGINGWPKRHPLLPAAAQTIRTKLKHSNLSFIFNQPYQGCLANVMHDNKSMMANKCTSFAGRSDGLGDPPLQYPAHCPMEVILGCIGGHWKPPPGDYLHRIALAADRVIGFGTHKQGCGCENGTSSEASSKKAQNGPSTPHVIDAASFVKLRHCTIGAEELSYFSSYQTLTAYKNW